MKFILKRLFYCAILFLSVSCQLSSREKIKNERNTTLTPTEKLTGDGLFQCFPDTLIRGGQITLNLPALHPNQLAIAAPGNHFFYIQFPPYAKLLSLEDFKKTVTI